MKLLNKKRYKSFFVCEKTFVEKVKVRKILLDEKRHRIR